MRIVEQHQNFIEQITQTYLKRFKLYNPGDFLQDVLLNLLEKESEIWNSYQQKNKNKVPFKSYLARTVWNECIDLGKKKYAKQYKQAVNQIDIHTTPQVKSVRDHMQDEEDEREILMKRIQTALESKRLKKNRLKIELFLNLKKGSSISREDLEKCFPNSPNNAVQKCLNKLKNAKTEAQKYQAIAQISGKSYETEQRWFNYQLSKIRELINSRIL